MQITVSRLCANNLVKTFLTLIATLAISFGGFVLLKGNVLPQIPTTLVAVVWGVLSVILIFYSLNLLAGLFPTKIYNGIVPYIFIGPAVLIMGWYLFLPTMRSLYLSFLDKGASKFVGLDNYKFLFTDRSMLVSIRNTLIWIMDGLRWGLPVVTHSVSARGYDAFKDAGCLFSYSNVEEFLSAIQQLKSLSMSKREIQALYISLFSFEAGVERLSKVLE